MVLDGCWRAEVWYNFEVCDICSLYDEARSPLARGIPDYCKYRSAWKTSVATLLDSYRLSRSAVARQHPLPDPELLRHLVI